MIDVDESGGSGETANDSAGMERRILRSMVIATAVAVLICLPLAPWRVTFGLLLGGVLSLFNHHWLRTSIAAALSGAGSERGVRLKASRFVLRYLIIGLVIFVAGAFDPASVPAMIAGMCSFVVAIFVESSFLFYNAIIHREEK